RKERTPGTPDKMKSLNAGVWVVNKVDKIKSKETLPIQTVEYSYGKSIVHKELGFLGFEEFFSKSYDEINSTNYTENKQYFTTISDESNKIFSVIPEKNITLRNGNPISESIFNKQIHSFSDGNFQIYDVNSISIDYINESMITNNYTYYPINNNIWTEESTVSNLNSSKIVKVDTKTIAYGSHGLQRGGVAVDNKIETVTTTSEYRNYDAETGELIPLTNNNPIQSTTTKYEYKGSADNFLLDKEINFFEELKAVESIFEY
ncbi:MAG: hypothetical protein RIF34_11490, partial [Candidatus Kapaibacterium sp.]